MIERTGNPANDQELAALADGTLDPERRREIENQLGSSEKIRESIHRQRAAIELTRELDVPASDALHARVAEMAAAAAPRRRTRLEIGGLVAAAAAVAVAIALVVTTGPAAPDVNKVVATAAQGPTSDAPALDPADSSKLDVAVGSVRFPSWKGDAGWSATGARTDTIGGRRVETVFYKNPDGATLKYSVVDGAPIDTLDPPATQYLITGSGDTRRIVWRAGGHTCIIDARGVAPDELEKLIA